VHVDKLLGKKRLIRLSEVGKIAPTEVVIPFSDGLFEALAKWYLNGWRD